MKESDIFDDDDDDDYKEVTQTCRSREDSVLSEQQRRSGRESTEAAIGIVIMVKIGKIGHENGPDHFSPNPNYKTPPSSQYNNNKRRSRVSVSKMWRAFGALAWNRHEKDGERPKMGF